MTRLYASTPPALLARPRRCQRRHQHHHPRQHGQHQHGPAGPRVTIPSAHPLCPTLHGHITSRHDVLLILGACLAGRLAHVPRAPWPAECPTLIRSGAIFVYEEAASGIREWADGLPWGPVITIDTMRIQFELQPAWATIQQDSPNGHQPVAKHNGLLRVQASVALDPHTHHLVAYSSTTDFWAADASNIAHALRAALLCPAAAPDSAGPARPSPTQAQSAGDDVVERTYDKTERLGRDGAVLAVRAGKLTDGVNRTDPGVTELTDQTY